MTPFRMVSIVYPDREISINPLHIVKMTYTRDVCPAEKLGDYQLPKFDGVHDATSLRIEMHGGAPHVLTGEDATRVHNEIIEMDLKTDHLREKLRSLL